MYNDFQEFKIFCEQALENRKKYFPEDIKKTEPISKLENKTVFRPKIFNEYIGQTKAKKILTQYIKGTKERKKIFPHVLLTGGAGMGKTTLAGIIAQELGIEFISVVASEFNFDIENYKDKIIFLDECHSLDRTSLEKLYPYMESEYFTLIGATTEVGEIIQKARPFYDRFKIVIELDRYNIDDLILIQKQYRKKTFEKDIIEEINYKTIADNSRCNPRTAIRLLDSLVYCNLSINDILSNFNILQDGYTTTDLRVLEYLKDGKTIGLQAISLYLNTSQENYLYNTEAWLLQNNLISRTARGRKITEDGLKKLEELQRR